MSDASYSNINVQIKPMKLEDIHDMVNNVKDEHLQMMRDTFMGIRTVVDKSLEGMDYYIAISSELEKYLKLRRLNK